MRYGPTFQKKNPHHSVPGPTGSGAWIPGLDLILFIFGRSVTFEVSILTKMKHRFACRLTRGFDFIPKRNKMAFETPIDNGEFNLGLVGLNNNSEIISLVEILFFEYESYYVTHII